MKMYKILSVAFLLLVTTGTLKAQMAKDGLVWVFNGDSITDANRYSNYMEAYFHLRYPQYQMHFRSVGRGGAQLNHMLQPASGQGPHYKNRAYSFSPDVISIMYGHNDGSYSNAAWRSILENTLDEIEANSASDIVLLGPHPKHGGGKLYLEDFNQIFVDVGVVRGYPAVDTWSALKPVWDSQSGASLGVFDGIHPGATGHACMAATLLKGLNEERLVSSATINAVNGTLIASTSATISNISITANGITFSRLDDRLPMAFDPGSYPALEFCPDILDMNQYVLTVSGLASGIYDVYVDGVKSASGVSSNALARASGWNMMQMSEGPIYDQLNDVINAIRDKQGIGTASLDRVGPPWKGIEKYISAVKKKTGSYASMISSTVGVRAELDALDVIINNLAQPMQRNFELRRVGPAPPETSVPDLSGGASGDGDGDGIVDSAQSDVTSFLATDGTNWLTYRNNSAGMQSNVLTSIAPAGVPADQYLVYGATQYDVAIAAGASITIEVYVTQNTAIQDYLLLSNDGQWKSQNATVTHIGNKTKLVFAVTEGGEFDRDASANGTLQLAQGGVMVLTGFEISPYAHSFGITALNTPTDNQAFTITNKGSRSLTFTTAALSGAYSNQFSVSSDNCSGQTIAAGASCVVGVNMQPTSVGSKSAWLEIITDDPDNATTAAFLNNYESIEQQARRRLPPVLYSLTGLPQVMTIGQSYNVTWELLGYHDDYFSTIVFFDCTGVASNCGSSYSSNFETSGVLSAGSVSVGNWSYGGTQSKRSSFSYTFTPTATQFPNPADIVVRFYRKNADDSAAGKGSLSLIIPGNLSDVYYDTSGRRIQKQVE